LELAIWRVCLICCGVQAIFYHKFFIFFIPTNPLQQSGIFLELLLEKNIIATKMKENAEWLVLYEDLSHFPMEITTSGLKCTLCA